MIDRVTSGEARNLAASGRREQCLQEEIIKIDTTVERLDAHALVPAVLAMVINVGCIPAHCKHRKARGRRHLCVGGSAHREHHWCPWPESGGNLLNSTDEVRAHDRLR